MMYQIFDINKPMLDSPIEIEGKSREAKNRCKWYYDWAFEIYERMGLEPAKNLL